MKVYKQEEITEIQENFEWLRKKEHFNTSDAGRVANMSSKYLGKTVNCMSCGGGLWKAKWDLVGWFSGILAAVEAGTILIEEDIFKAVEEAEASKTDEEIIIDIEIDAAPPVDVPAAETIVEKAKKEVIEYSKKKRGFKL